MEAIPPRSASRVVDENGKAWRIARREISAASGTFPAGTTPTSGNVKDGSAPLVGFHRALVLVVCAPLETIDSNLAALGWSLAGLSLGAWFLATLLCRWLSRHALRPLSTLVESARVLDPDDAGWYLASTGTRDELDELGRAFNELLSRLHLAYERQRRFTGDASHQLRTPITVLIGQIEVALKKERPVTEYQRVLHSALRQATQLARITDALLFLAKADSQAALPGCEVVDMGRWISTYTEGLAAERSQNIVLSAGSTEANWVQAHPALLGQLLDNLLDNARKYGPRDKPVVVEIKREGTDVVMAVEDQGPGIRADDLDHIFEPFYRSSQERGTNVPGVGLGLCVVRRIALAFGGSVRVRGGQPCGSRFEIRLPRAAPPDEPERESDASWQLIVDHGQGEPARG